MIKDFDEAKITFSSSLYQKKYLFDTQYDRSAYTKIEGYQLLGK